MGSEDAVAEIAQELQMPAFRRHFFESPEEAVGELPHGSELPPALLDTLKGLSLLELGVVARISRELDPLKGDRVMIMMPL